MDVPSFETERDRCKEAAVGLAAQLLYRNYHSNGRVAQCLGPREFGLTWMSENIVPRDRVFEERVLGRFLELTGV